MNNKIAISIGDPNSISPEITIKAINSLSSSSVSLVLFASEALLEYYEKTLGLKLYPGLDVEVVDIGYEMGFSPGIESGQSGEYAFRALDAAVDYCQKYNVKSLVTAPVSKNAISLAGHAFSGQTEVLQSRFVNGKAQMLFAARDFRVLLLTRHIPISQVSQAISKELVMDSVESVYSSLQTQLGIGVPSFAICGLNPHCGENGLIGQDEQATIIPAISMLNKKNISIEGPFAADTLLADAVDSYLKNSPQKYDCYIACYHDQGLIPIKAVARHDALNITIGLDVLRTSPAHGTAFDIAGRNIANYSSMLRAIEFFTKSGDL